MKALLAAVVAAAYLTCVFARDYAGAAMIELNNQEAAR